MNTVMIVDDNTFDREGVRKMIDWKSLDAEVVATAVNGRDGVEKAVQFKPDFIISDVSMPVMDGLEMARKIKESLPETKFIFFSCFDKFDYAQSAVDLAASAYLLKPINLEELYGTLSKLVDLKHFEQQRVKEERYLKEQLHKSLPVLKRQLIHDVIFGQMEADRKSQKQLEFLELEGKKYCIASISFTKDYPEAEKEDIEQEYLRLHIAMELGQKYLFEDMEGILLEQTRTRLLLVYWMDEVDEQDPWREILIRIDRYKYALSETSGISSLVLVGGIMEDIFQLHKEFCSIEKILSGGYLTDTQQILMAKELEAKKQLEDENDLTDIGSALKKAMEGKEEQVHEFIRVHMESGAVISKQSTIAFVYAVVYALQMLLLEKNKGFQDVFDSNTVVWEKLARIDSIVNIKNWLYNMIITVRQELYSTENSRFTKIAEDIKRIVEQDYATVQNINDIAQQLYISPNYASSIFKQVTGKTIFDYLIEVRMEVAKKLLRNPYSKVYEIAEQVGYVSKSYFTVAFKEYVGMTPKQYRENAG